MKSKLNLNQEREHTRRKFLLSFFDEESGYEERCVNGFWLIKQFEAKLNLWIVAIYKPEAYRKRKERQLRFRGNCGERSKIN